MKNRAAREQKRARVVVVSRGVVSVRKKIACVLAQREPIFVERRDREHVGDEHLLDEFHRALDQFPKEGDSLRIDHREGFVGVHGRAHAAHQKGLRVRILAAQRRVDANEVLLPRQRLQIMRNGKQIHLGRQLIGGMAPIAAGEQAQLTAIDHSFDALLDTFEIRRAGFVVIRNGLRDERS